MNRGLPLPRNGSQVMRGTEKSQVPKEMQTQVRSPRVACLFSFRYVHGGGRDKEGRPSLPCSGFVSILPELSGRPRRNPLIAFSGNPGLNVFLRTPGQGFQFGARHSASCLVVKEREMLRNEIWITY